MDQFIQALEDEKREKEMAAAAAAAKDQKVSIGLFDKKSVQMIIDVTET